MAKKATITIYNDSAQRLDIHACPPGGDFYQHEQQISIKPGQVLSMYKDHVNMDQVTNLRSRGFIKVLNDSENE